MENKYVGYILLSISVLLVIIIFLFNSTLKEVISASCGLEHGPFCPMNQSVDRQTYLALGMSGLLVIVSVFLIFSKPQIREKVIIKNERIVNKRRKINLNGFRPEDKQVLKLVQEKGAVFQAELIEKTGYGKAKMTRIIDRLEGKNIVERRRRGMTNIVVLNDR